jgi:membrane-bound lytic murein transglycosylase D
LKNTTFALLFSFACPLFAQQSQDVTASTSQGAPLSYLDSLKTTFVKDDMALCVDSLWMNELNNLNLYDEMALAIEEDDKQEMVDYDLSTDLLKERLQAMNAKSPFRIEYHSSLENVIKSYLKYRKKSMSRLMAISQYYFPIFEEAFAQKNIPLEIKYLAVVESALNPRAVSRVGASGLWQFMYQTGKQYNLKIDSYIDERSDPVKATAAAAQYMTNMYGIFGDWELVLAAYNSGPGNVAKAIRRSGGQQNYWNIRSKLPKETRGYVPAFIATMYLYEYGKEHGIEPDEATMQHFETDTIRIKKQMSFKQVSDLLDLPVAELQLLNPSYKLNIIPFYDDEDHYLTLPKDKIAVFVSNEEKIYAYLQREVERKENPFGQQSASSLAVNSTVETVKRVQIKYYTIRKGDNLGAIANKFKVAVSALKKWNKLRSNKIVYGQRLKIITQKTYTIKSQKSNSNASVSTSTVRGSSRESNKRAHLVASRKPTSYYVKRGDSLYSIARKYPGVSIADIKKWNDISGEVIKPGMKLKING